MKYIVLMLLFVQTMVFAVLPQQDGESPEKIKQQEKLRWQASGGQADVKFMYEKLKDMHIHVSPAPEFPNKHWDYNHLVYPISNSSALEIKMPYGVIEEVTSGVLAIDSNFTLTYGKHSIKVNSFKLVPNKKPSNKSDIVTFNLVDQNNHHLFNIDSVHIEYNKDKGLLLMSNMDLFATKKLAQLLHFPELENQVIGQIHTYNKLSIPNNAETELKGGFCANRPIWPPNADVDVQLIDIGSVQWMRNIGVDKIIIAPSARLKNIGSAEVPWHEQFSGGFPPYNSDQHPFLNWAIYREINSRFEQMAISGVKHAFLTINSNCGATNCNDSHILWLNCEDVYGTGNNDSSLALGPRQEIGAFAGTWDNCGSFFDPNCIGSHQVSSNGTDENRLAVNNAKLTDVNNSAVFMQAWYLIRDDVNIFNSMGYRSLNPQFSNSTWSMNMGASFANGAALDNYVPKNTISTMQSSQTIASNEGHFTVAVKVVDLGAGLYRYNYAIENYDFDPRFNKFIIPLHQNSSLTDTVFNDPDEDVFNDWTFVRNNGMLEITGDVTNEQNWGMLYSFSFTTDVAPVVNSIELNAAQAVLNQSVTVTVLIPDLIYINSFETP